MIYYLFFLLPLLFTPLVNAGEIDVGILTHLMKRLSLHASLDKELYAPWDKRGSAQHQNDWELDQYSLGKKCHDPWDKESFKVYRDPVQYQEDWELDQYSEQTRVLPVFEDETLEENETVIPETHAVQASPANDLTEPYFTKPFRFGILNIALNKIASLLAPFFPQKKQEVEQKRELEREQKREQETEQTVWKIGKLKISSDDLCTLNPKEYTNDQILNACFTMAQESHRQLRASQSASITTAILHSQFFIKIQAIGTSDRHYYYRWLTNQGFHIEKLEYLIIPANPGKHWFIAVIDIPKDRIEIYNSLPGHSVKKEVDQITNWWLWYSSELYDTDTDVASCPVIYHHKVRQAIGSNDCGIAVVMVAACIAHHLPPTKTMQERGLYQAGLGQGRAAIKRAIQENSIAPLLSILRIAN